jgi:hypothetical protein
MIAFKSFSSHILFMSLMNYDLLLMDAISAESDGRIITPRSEAQEHMDYLVGIGYFKHVNIAKDMSGYALTPKGRPEAWKALERHKDLRDVLSKL